MLVMDATELAAFLDEVFPQVEGAFSIERLEEDELQVRLNVKEHHLRPGGTVSGPSIFALADCAVGRSASGAPMLYVAAGRAGLVRVDLERAIRGGRGLPDQVLPLGGWAVGVSVVPEPGRVLVSCQKGGLAVLAERVAEPGDADLER